MRKKKLKKDFYFVLKDKTGNILCMQNSIEGSQTKEKTAELNIHIKTFMIA